MGAKHPKYIVYMYEIVKEFLKNKQQPPHQGSEEVRRTTMWEVGGEGGCGVVKGRSRGGRKRRRRSSENKFAWTVA